VQTLQFEERLYPSLGMYLAYALLSPMVLLAAAPFGWGLAITLGMLTLFVGLVLASVFSPMVLVDETRIAAGRISLPIEFVGSAEIIKSGEIRSELGPKLDARAQLLIRGDLKTAVKVTNSDPKDPTPYLIISTRRPKELVSALRANRS
jgi:hypothetical protein